jgi:hypothetical protein
MNAQFSRGVDIRERKDQVVFLISTICEQINRTRR